MNGAQYNHPCKRLTADAKKTCNAAILRIHLTVTQVCDNAGILSGQIPMSLLTALFQRPARRHYALLDEDQCCRMLLTSEQPPRSGHWVQVDEVCLGWIGRPLPHQARQIGHSQT